MPNSAQYTYTAVDVEMIRNYLLAASDAITLMRLVIDDSTKLSFDNLIVHNLNGAIDLLNMPIRKEEHNYAFEEALEEVRAADAAEKTSKRTRKGE